MRENARAQLQGKQMDTFVVLVSLPLLETDDFFSFDSGIKQKSTQYDQAKRKQLKQMKKKTRIGRFFNVCRIVSLSNRKNGSNISFYVNSVKIQLSKKYLFDLIGSQGYLIFVVNFLLYSIESTIKTNQLMYNGDQWQIFSESERIKSDKTHYVSEPFRYFLFLSILNPIATNPISIMKVLMCNIKINEKLKSTSDTCFTS